MGMSAQLASANVVGIAEPSPGAVGNALAGFGHVSSHVGLIPHAPNTDRISHAAPFTLPYTSARTQLWTTARILLASSPAPEPCSSGSFWSSR